jgi:hypothetical protein
MQKKIIMSLTPLIVIVILFIVVGQFGISRIIDIKKQIQDSEKDLVVLTQKLDILRSLSGSVSQDVQVSSVVLPDTNPSLIAMTQIKVMGSNNGIVVSGFKSGSAKDNPTGVSSVDILFQAVGTRTQIIAFLKDVSKFAPITIVDKLNITESSGTTQADVSVKTFWSALPKSIPEITSPITDLTAAEKKVLTDVEMLTKPTFFSVPANEGGGRADPFNN